MQTLNITEAAHYLKIHKVNLFKTNGLHFPNRFKTAQLGTL